MLNLTYSSLDDLKMMAANYRAAIKIATDTIADLTSDLADIERALATRVDPNGPLTADQRKALFAAFTDVFGDSDQPKRIAFTAMVLGKDAADVAISWSSYKPGRLTYAEASKVLDALDSLNV